MTTPELTPEEQIVESIEDALVEYDVDGRIFGTSGAGAYFLAQHLAPHVLELLAEQREQIAAEIEAYRDGRREPVACPAEAWDRAARIVREGGAR